MCQVLFRIPIYWFGPEGIPIYGYGAMLFVAFVACTWLACRLADRQGVPRERIQDLAIWLFVSGIAGARITFMVQYHVPVYDFYKIWEGGLVFYGSAIGGAIGYFLYWLLVLRRQQVSSWKLADIVAPCAALGLCLGRFGCLFNGCCYGNVACPDCPSVSFPLAAQPRFVMTAKGYQTAAGFVLKGESNTVAQVEPGSAAERAGLREGEQIVKVDGKEVFRARNLDEVFGQGEWPRGKNDVALTVQPAWALPVLGASTVGLLASPLGPWPVDAASAAVHTPSNTWTPLPPFVPRTIGLNPTQVYESISMLLLFALLLAFYPYRRHDGEVMVVFMLGYALHRFFNEVLRVDTDPITVFGWATGMTLSQNVSVLVLAAGLVLGFILWRKPVQYHPPRSQEGQSESHGVMTPPTTISS